MGTSSKGEQNAIDSADNSKDHESNELPLMNNKSLFFYITTLVFRTLLKFKNVFVIRTIIILKQV